MPGGVHCMPLSKFFSLSAIRPCPFVCLAVLCIARQRQRRLSLFPRSVRKQSTETVSCELRGGSSSSPHALLGLLSLIFLITAWPYRLSIHRARRAAAVLISTTRIPHLFGLGTVAGRVVDLYCISPHVWHRSRAAALMTTTNTSVF